MRHCTRLAVLFYPRCRTRRQPTSQKRKTLSRCISTKSEPNSQSKDAPHTPVLLDEVLHQFSGLDLRRFVDGTLGAGGHSSAVFQDHTELESFIGLDIDPIAHELAAKKLKDLCGELNIQPQMSFFRQNYSQISSLIQQSFEGIKVDGILLDLGVSSMQFDTGERGFSIRHDGPLDMRMSPDSYITAETIVNTWSEYDLGNIFREFGEERHWRSYAARVVDAREKGPIKSTSQLVKALGKIGGSKSHNRKTVHPATRIFQALRIAVNVELEHLSKAIPACIENLRPGGRLAIISFHSLEDRMVKQAFLKASGKLENPVLLETNIVTQPEGKIVTRKPIGPSNKEQDENPRSRSAKLRVFERT